MNEARCTLARSSPSGGATTKQLEIACLGRNFVLQSHCNHFQIILSLFDQT
jgi:hypothetical protein